MPILLRKRSIVSLIAALGLLLAVIAANFFLNARQLQDQEGVQHSLNVELRLARIFSMLQDAETGQRGYLLTREEPYLDPYNAAVQTINSEMAALGSMVAGNSGQSQQLAALRDATREKLDELSQTIKLARDGKRDAAIERVRDGAGRNIMHRIRDLVQVMNASEQQLLSQRQSRSIHTAHLARAWIVLALVLTALLGALALWDSQRLFAAAVGASEALQTSNKRLVDEMLKKERLELQLRQSQKLEAIGQLTGGIAHDFNNMLAVVISSLNLLKRKAERGEKEFLKFADSAIEGAERAAALTHRLLAFGRQQPLAPQPVDCNKFVAAMSDLLQRTLGDGVKVETVLAGGLWRTFVDPSELESAILNLAINGRDAMPDGGKLTIETANASLDDDYCEQNVGVAPGQYVLVTVTDTGAGMTQDVVAKVFDPFFTTKGVGKGTGLGLSQVFGFVKQSGGHVKIYSELGQGTSVKIYLPHFFGDDAEPAQTRPPTAEPIPMGSPDILVLIVEDEDRMLRLASEGFRDLGYSVLQADGPSAALRIISERSDIDLLFTDVVMPGMSGRALAEEALRRRPGLKVIFTTGFSRNAVIHNGVLDRGVNFLAKPFTLEQLARKVSAALKGAKNAPAGCA